MFSQNTEHFKTCKFTFRIGDLTKRILSYHKSQTVKIDCHNRPLMNSGITSVANQRPQRRSASENYSVQYDLNLKLLLILFYVVDKCMPP